MHSRTAFVEKAYWKGAVAFAIVFATRRRIMCPTTIPHPSIRFVQCFQSHQPDAIDHFLRNIATSQLGNHTTPSLARSPRPETNGQLSYLMGQVQKPRRAVLFNSSDNPCRGTGSLRTGFVNSLNVANLPGATSALRSLRCSRTRPCGPTAQLGRTASVFRRPVADGAA